MDRTVYFADKALLFATQAPVGKWCATTPEQMGGVSRDKILKILETHNCVAVVSPDPEVVFADFATGFTTVEAAGGVVVNERGEWLMIHRSGRWDFPKGHVERDERIDACAAREIAEETGVEALIVCPLCQTLHAYYFARTERWELKRTHWFELHASACSGLRPQIEEGIDRVAWCRPEEVARNLVAAFPTIRCVAASMKNESY